MQAGLRESGQGHHRLLTPREAQGAEHAFGIEMSTDHTLEEVGKQFDVTRERIRQIEAKAIRKLSTPSRSAAADLPRHPLSLGARRKGPARGRAFFVPPPLNWSPMDRSASMA